MKRLVLISISLLMLSNSRVVLAEEFVMPEPPEAPTVPDYVEEGGGNSSSQTEDAPDSTDDPDSSVSSPVPVEPTNPIEEPTPPETEEEPATDAQDIFLEEEEAAAEESEETVENENEGNPAIGADISTVVRVVVFIGGSIAAIVVMRKMGFIGQRSE